jgi:hypothetical protein
VETPAAGSFCRRAALSPARLAGVLARGVHSRRPSLDDPEERLMTTTELTPTPEPVAPDATVSRLVAGIIDDAQKLVRQQVEMLKSEVREDFRRSKRAAEYGSLGIVLLTVGFLGLVTSLAYLLHERFQYSLWASWGITGGIFLIAGAALAATSYILLERFNPLPDKTFNALQENLTWTNKPQS